MKVYYIIISLLIGTFFVGCASSSKIVLATPFEDIDKLKLNVSSDAKQLNDDHIEYEEKEEERVAFSEKKRIEKIPSFKKDKLIKKALLNYEGKNEELLVLEEGKVKINVESIPLNEFIDFIFGHVLKVNYSVDKSIRKLKQPITLNMARTESRESLLKVVKHILLSEGVTVEVENSVLFIKKNIEKINKVLTDNKHIIFGRELPSSIAKNKEVVMFVPYYYTEPRKIEALIRQLYIPINFIFFEKNLKILKGKASDMRKVLEIIELMDQPSMVNKSSYLLNLNHIEVSKFKEKMESIFKLNSIPVVKNSHEIGIILEPIEELNALLVMSSNSEWIEKLRFWQEKIDIESQVLDEMKLFFYKVKNRKADELEKLIQNIFSNTATGRDSNTSINNNISSMSTEDNSASVSIQSDLYTNSLMFKTTLKKYKEILSILKRFDRVPLQVLVEVTLAEVDITKNFNLGFEWSILNNKAISSKNTNSGTHILGISSTGITSSFFPKNLTSIINAFAEDKKLDILSRPKLLILNNTTGSINVGQQIPTISSEVSVSDVASRTPSLLRNVTYTNTGITLNLTPTINSNGTLTLDVNVVLSEATTNRTSSIDSPLIINRDLSTSIAMKDDSSVLIGGLISKNISNGDSGVPVLKDLPLIGYIFRGESSAYIKKELIILIHPRIIKSNDELEDETRKYKLLLRSIKNII